MNHTEMQKYCPKSKFLGRTYLKNYKFIYDGYSVSRNCSVANVVQSCGDKVWGGLYEITENDLGALDMKEGFPKAYQRGVVEVVNNDKRYEAITFFRNEQLHGDPNDAYREIIIKGAIDCHLPTEYIDTYIRQ